MAPCGWGGVSVGGGEGWSSRGGNLGGGEKYLIAHGVGGGDRWPMERLAQGIRQLWNGVSGESVVDDYTMRWRPNM